MEAGKEGERIWLGYWGVFADFQRDVEHCFVCVVLREWVGLTGDTSTLTPNHPRFPSRIVALQ